MKRRPIWLGVVMPVSEGMEPGRTIGGSGALGPIPPRSDIHGLRLSLEGPPPAPHPERSPTAPLAADRDEPGAEAQRLGGDAQLAPALRAAFVATVAVFLHLPPPPIGSLAASSRARASRNGTRAQRFNRRTVFPDERPKPWCPWRRRRPGAVSADAARPATCHGRAADTWRCSAPRRPRHHDGPWRDRR